MATKCPFCGRKNPADAETCDGCGATILDRNRKEPAAEPDALEAQLLELLRQGRKIQAIKLYRANTSEGLKEAKDFVEGLARRHDLPVGGSGCAGVLLLLLAATAIGLRVLC